MPLLFSRDTKCPLRDWSPRMFSKFMHGMT